MTIDRHAIEIRLLLDLVVYELGRLGLEAGTPVRVRVGTPDLSEGLADRLWPDHDVAADASSAVGVHLLDLEESGLPDRFDDRVVVVFRNRISHKALRYPAWRGIAFPRVERRLARSHDLTASRGVMGPVVFARLLAAEAANRRGRFDVGFHRADRALLSPSSWGPDRLVAPYGVIAATRRP